ncbi:MAG: hypothetical protein Q7T51_04295 [Candidatus Moranbacteria bacterium]|nr:hypothetical protein [Candidatus Moranbacteria bacterium]
MHKTIKNMGVIIFIVIFAISPLRIDLMALSKNIVAGEVLPLEDLYISENTTWNNSTDLSNYGNIYVNWGVTLTIEKGTQLAFRHLSISGNVIAQGTKEEKIKLAGIPLTFEEGGAYNPRCFMSPTATIEFSAPGDYVDDPESIFEFVEFSQMGDEFSYDTDSCPGLGMNNGLKDMFFPVAYAAPVNEAAPAMTLYSGRVKMSNCDFKNNAYADIKVETEYGEWNSQSYLFIENSNFQNNSQDTAVTAKVTKPDVYNALFENCFNECKLNYPDDYGIYGPICGGYCTNVAGSDPSFHDKTKVLLKSNWYGDPAGPEIESAPNVGGEKLIGDYTSESWSATEIENSVPSVTASGASNVLFLPGLEASRLYTDGVIGTENQLWEPNRDADVEKLFLDKNGKSLDPDVYTRDVLDEVNVSPLIGQKNIYNSFKADLEKWKNDDKIINDYVAMPYDWRLSLEDILTSGTFDGKNISYTQASISPYIVRELRRLAETSKTGKVTIVAHSNGGLLAKALTNKLGAEAESLIDKIVMVAVPQVGTPQAIGGILHGYDQGLPADWFPLLLAPKVARTLANNMPSAYNLLPSSAYFNGNGSSTSTPMISFENGSLTQSFINKYGNEIDNPTELHDFLLDSERKVSADSNDVVSPSSINAKLLGNAEDVHQALDDNWTVPASISVYQIAGFGEETLGTIKYWTGIECSEVFEGKCLAYRDKIQYTPDTVIDGDGTVVAPSALAMSANENVKRYWVDLDDYNIPVVRSIEHADILEVSELRSFIKDNILTQSSTSFPQFISDSKPSNSSEKRLHYILHSPLALSAHDTSGNEISASVSTIPGAIYKRFGEVQFISLSASVAHTVTLDGLAEGSFTLEMQEVENDAVVAKTTFAGVPSSDKAKVTMEVIDGTIQNASPLAVDFDGNSVIDFSLQPKVGETVMQPTADQTPPEARIFFDTQTNSMRVEGIDENPTTVTYVTSAISKKNSKYSDRERENERYVGKMTTATITDQAGNVTILKYTEKFVSHDRRVAVELNSISYNGVVTKLHDTMAKYNWSLNRKGATYSMFATNLRTSSSAIESHYRPKQNVTMIMTRPQELHDDRDDDDDADRRAIKQKLVGLIVPELTTKQGIVEIKY